MPRKSKADSPLPTCLLQAGSLIACVCLLENYPQRFLLGEEGFCRIPRRGGLISKPLIYSSSEASSSQDLFSSTREYSNFSLLSIFLSRETHQSTCPRCLQSPREKRNIYIIHQLLITVMGHSNIVYEEFQVASNVESLHLQMI